MAETLVFIAFIFIISLLIMRDLRGALVLWLIVLTVWYGSLFYIYIIVKNGGHITI